MKLYGAKMAANPRRVKIYLAEKGIEIEQIDFSPPFRELSSAEFRAKSPTGLMPVLELGDGVCIPESTAIIEYFEELHPEPNLIGTTAEQRARVRAIGSVVSDLVVTMGTYCKHASPTFLPALGLTRRPDTVEFLLPCVERGLAALETMIGEEPFLAGERVTTADCHFFALLSACVWKLGYELPARFPHLRRWFEEFSRRPSARA